MDYAEPVECLSRASLTFSFGCPPDIIVDLGLALSIVANAWQGITVGCTEYL